MRARGVRWSWGRSGAKWESAGGEAEDQLLGFDCPVWCVLCRGGRAWLQGACQRGRGAFRLPADMLSIKLPQLFDIHQVPKVSAAAAMLAHGRTLYIEYA